MSGVSVDTPNSDIQAAQADIGIAMVGGEHFLARVKILSDLRDQVNKATQDLNLSKRGQALLASAEQELKEAQAARTVAAGVLAEAKLEARRLVEKAHQGVLEARAGAEEIRNQANDVLRKARQEADGIVQEASVIKETIVEQESHLQQKIKAAEAAEATHLESRQRFSDATADSRAAEAAYQSVLASIQGSLSRAQQIISGVKK